MEALHVPMFETHVEVVTLPGRVLKGRVFVPAAARRHEGPMRMEEWMNSRSRFFPLVTEEGHPAVLINKTEVLMLTYPASLSQPPDAPSTDHRVVVEFSEGRVEGILSIEMPEDHSRVLDFLNQAEEFFLLKAGDRHHLIQKNQVLEVVERER
jgi:hypothetical protein